MNPFYIIFFMALAVFSLKANADELKPDGYKVDLSTGGSYHVFKEIDGQSYGYAQDDVVRPDDIVHMEKGTYDVETLAPDPVGDLRITDDGFYRTYDGQIYGSEVDPDNYDGPAPKN